MKGEYTANVYTWMVNSRSHHLGSGERPSKVSAELGSMARWHTHRRCSYNNDEC